MRGFDAAAIRNAKNKQRLIMWMKTSWGHFIEIRIARMNRFGRLWIARK